MRITGIQINGINISDEHGHYLLEKDNRQMRCDIGELNEAVPEFEQMLIEAQKQYDDQESGQVEKAISIILAPLTILVNLLFGSHPEYIFRKMMAMRKTNRDLKFHDLKGVPANILTDQLPEEIKQKISMVMEQLVTRSLPSLDKLLSKELTF